MQENKQEKSQIKQKILRYLRFKGVSEYKFYKDSGVTRGVLQQPNGISEDNLSRFLAYAADVNSEWLLTGRGAMLKTNETDSTHVHDEDSGFFHEENKVLPFLHERNTVSIETRPRIPFDAVAGSLSFAMNGVSSDECEQLPLIPTFPKYDFTIIARGDSMFPDFHSGDELACAFVEAKSFIQWGRVHVLDTAQGVVLKRIFNQKDAILCKSINNDYPDFEIPKNEIYHLAIVVGLIRHF